MERGKRQTWVQDSRGRGESGPEGGLGSLMRRCQQETDGLCSERAEFTSLSAEDSDFQTAVVPTAKHFHSGRFQNFIRAPQTTYSQRVKEAGSEWKAISSSLSEFKALRTISTRDSGTPEVSHGHRQSMPERYLGESHKSHG